MYCLFCFLEVINRGSSSKTPATHKKNGLSSKNLFSEDEEPTPAQTRECTSYRK